MNKIHPSSKDCLHPIAKLDLQTYSDNNKIMVNRFPNHLQQSQNTDHFSGHQLKSISSFDDGIQLILQSK